MTFVSRHSKLAVVWAMKYAGQFALRRKEDALAAGVLYVAVVQNSRKWKAERADQKKGMRQRGSWITIDRRMVVKKQTEKAEPRRKEWRDIVEREMGPSGKSLGLRAGGSDGLNNFVSNCPADSSLTRGHFAPPAYSV